MDIIRPYKMVVQFVAASAINIFNFLMKESNLDKMKQKLLDSERRHEVAQQERDELRLAIDGYPITTRDDYVHQLTIDHSNDTSAIINIRDEFNQFTLHLHND